jgi:hypothetical protein
MFADTKEAWSSNDKKAEPAATKLGNSIDKVVKIVLSVIDQRG